MKADELLEALERLVAVARASTRPETPSWATNIDLSAATAALPCDAIAQIRELRALLDDPDAAYARKRISELEQQIEQERAAHKSELRRAWRPWPPEGPERRVNAISIIEDEERYELFCPMSTDTWDGEGYEVFWCEIEESKP